MRKLLVTCVFLYANTALAVPVLWTFQDVYLASGSQITGSFVYDADAPGDLCHYADVCPPDPLYPTTAYSDFDIQFAFTVPAEGYVTEYYSLNPENASVDIYDDFGENFRTPGRELAITCDLGACDGPTGLPGPDLSYAWQLNFRWDAPLTNAGGEVQLDCNGCYGVVEYDPKQQNYYYWAFVMESSSDYVVSGSLVGTVVPVPAAIWLFGSALVGLGWFRRKKA